jgi:hypothetical protein
MGLGKRRWNLRQSNGPWKAALEGILMKLYVDSITGENHEKPQENRQPHIMRLKITRYVRVWQNAVIAFTQDNHEKAEENRHRHIMRLCPLICNDFMLAILAENHKNISV